MRIVFENKSLRKYESEPWLVNKFIKKLRRLILSFCLNYYNAFVCKCKGLE